MMQTAREVWNDLSCFHARIRRLELRDTESTDKASPKLREVLDALNQGLCKMAEYVNSME